MNYFIEVENVINKFLKDEITNEKLIKLYFNIGKILEDKNKLTELEIFLKSKYGITISFTKRNFKNMINFYKKYKSYSLDYLSKISWVDHLQLLKNNIITDNNFKENFKKRNNKETYFLIEELLRIKKDLEKR